MVLAVCYLEGSQFPMATNVHWYFRHMGDRTHSAGFSVRESICIGFFALIILIPCLLQTSRSMKSSVAPESIMVLIVTDSVVPSSCILTMIWSLSLSSFCVVECRMVVFHDDGFSFGSDPPTISYWGHSSFPDCSRF